MRYVGGGVSCSTDTLLTILNGLGGFPLIFYFDFIDSNVVFWVCTLGRGHTLGRGYAPGRGHTPGLSDAGYATKSFIFSSTSQSFSCGTK